MFHVKHNNKDNIIQAHIGGRTRTHAPVGKRTHASKVVHRANKWMKGRLFVCWFPSIYRRKRKGEKKIFCSLLDIFLQVTIIESVKAMTPVEKERKEEEKNEIGRASRCK